MQTLLDQDKGDREVIVESLALNNVYSTKLNEEGERTRIEKLEMFDEFEEWELLLGHYCLTLAARVTP